MATTPAPQPDRIITWPKKTIAVHLSDPNLADGTLLLTIQRDAVTTNRFTKRELLAITSNIQSQLAVLPAVPPVPNPKTS